MKTKIDYRETYQTGDVIIVKIASGYSREKGYHAFYYNLFLIEEVKKMEIIAKSIIFEREKISIKDKYSESIKITKHLTNQEYNSLIQTGVFFELHPELKEYMNRI